MDTGRKLNVHKTFRRRPGRLLNVLCTFNLRPVSKSIQLTSKRGNASNHFTNMMLLPRQIAQIARC